MNDIVPSTVVMRTQSLRRTGRPDDKPKGGKRPYLLEAQRVWLLARGREKADLILHALLGERAEERGVAVSCDTLWRFLVRGARVVAHFALANLKLVRGSIASARWGKASTRRRLPRRPRSTGPTGATLTDALRKEAKLGGFPIA
ncbi:MAG: hypothetical protein AB1749_17135 [Pseudomonadota bacterium]